MSLDNNSHYSSLSTTSRVPHTVSPILDLERKTCYSSSWDPIGKGELSCAIGVKTGQHCPSAWRPTPRLLRSGPFRLWLPSGRYTKSLSYQAQSLTGCCHSPSHADATSSGTWWCHQGRTLGQKYKGPTQQNEQMGSTCYNY